MKFAKKAIAAGVAVVMAVTSAVVPIFAQGDEQTSAGNVREENGWLLRDHGANSYMTDTDGSLSGKTGVTFGCAGAYWKIPAGKEMFTATFDIDWGDANPVEGGANYDRFLKIGMTKDPTFPDGTDTYHIKSAFRLKSNHIDLDPGFDLEQDYYVSGSDSGLVGFNMIATDSVKGILSLKDNKLTLTIQTTTGADVNTQSRSFEYQDTYFDGSDLYVAFVNNGELDFTIRNFQITESDIAPTWIFNDVETPYVGDGNSLLAEDAVSNGAGAYFGTPVGKEAFKVSFDIDWNDDNGTLNNDANRIAMFLSKDTTYFSEESTFGNVPYNSVLVNNNHVDTSEKNEDAVSKSGITDGGADCGVSWALTENGPIHVTAELADRKLTITLTAADGEKYKIGWVQYEFSYIDGTPLYFGFRDIGGALKYAIRNFTVEETDASSTEVKPGWDIREAAGTDKPFTTNENNDLIGMEACGYAGAFWNKPIGQTGFKLTFDMEWTNIDAQSDDWFVRFGLVKDPSYPKGLGDAAFYEIPNSIRVKSNQLILHENDMDSAYYVKDSGKVSMDPGIDLSTADTVNVEYTLKDNVVTLTVTAATGSDVKKMSASFAYTEEFFNGDDLYLGVMNHGGFLEYNITNLQFVEYNGCLIDGDWYQRSMEHPYVVDGNSLLTMGDGVTVDENVGAIYAKPLGYNEFKAEFDLEVGSGMPTEGDANYDAHRLSVYLTKTIGFQEEPGAYFPTDSFIIRNKHIETTQGTGSNTSEAGGIIDGGGWLLSDAGTVHAVVEMKERRLTITLTSGENTKTQYFVYSSDYFNKQPIYLAFLRIGAFAHNIKNLVITETDLNSVSEDNFVEENGWRVRTGDGLVQYATDENKNLLGTASGSGAAAFWLEGVGYNAFKATFDLEWDAANLDQSAEKYWDNFLAVAVSKDPVFSKGADPEVPLGSFRVTTNHLQAAAEDMDTANLVQHSNTGQVGGLDLKGKTATVTVELNRRLFTLTVKTPDGKEAAASYKLTSSFFTGKPLYIGFFQNGDVKMNVKNFTVAESDVSTGGEVEPLPVPEGYTDDFTNSQWIARTGEGIQQFATNSEGNLYAYGNDNVNGAVWWNQKLPSKNFQVTFDLDWADDNRIEGQNNYLDSFLSINLSKSPTFAEGTDPIAPTGRFRVTTNHIQAVQADMDPAYLLPDEVFTPIVGGMNLADGPVSCTLMVDDEGIVWLTFEQAGVEPMEGAYTYSWEFYNDEAPLYIGFSNNGDMMYEISNIKYEEVEVEETVYKYFTGYVGGYFERVYGEFKDDYTKYLD